jgi:glycosyltransferase involved in cell wall biosynthesis
MASRNSIDRAFAGVAEAAPRVEFWSHTQFSGFLARIVEHLRAQGHDAEQMFLVSEEDYRARRGTFGSLWLRLRMFVLFPVMLCLRVLFKRREAVLVVTSNPFFAPLLARLFASRRVRVVHLLYDLYPDALVYAGKLGGGSIPCRILDNVQRSMLRSCDANVLLGDCLLAHVRERFGEPRHPVIIPVGANDAAFDSPLAAKSADTQPLHLLYCGNMGYMHDTRTLSSALLRLHGCGKATGYEFRFHASGGAYVDFCARLASLREPFVVLDGYLNAMQWAGAMSRADIAMVTMKDGSEHVVMPSKTYSAMQAGQAILAIAPLDSDLAALVRRHECGWVVAPGDVDGLVALLERLPSSRDEVRRMQGNSLSSANEHYSAAVVAVQWADLFRSIGPKD